MFFVPSVFSAANVREVYNPVVDLPRISDTDDAITERQLARKLNPDLADLDNK